MSKPQPRRPSTTCFAHLQGLNIIERKWIDVEPGAQFDQAYPVAKGQTLFLDTENYLEKQMVQSNSAD